MKMMRQLVTPISIRWANSLAGDNLNTPQIYQSQLTAWRPHLVYMRGEEYRTPCIKLTFVHTYVDLYYLFLWVQLVFNPYHLFLRTQFIITRLFFYFAFFFMYTCIFLLYKKKNLFRFLLERLCSSCVIFTRR